MAQLNHQDWSRMSEFLRDLYTCRPPSELPEGMIRGLLSLISSDNASYNEIDSRTNTVVFAINPWIHEVTPLVPALETHLPEHPQLRHFRSSPDRGAYQMTDFMSQRQWRETALYREFYRHVDTDNQLAILLSEPGAPCEIGIGIGRKDGSFSERDRAVLELLRPHLILARQNARVFAEAERHAHMLSETLDSARLGIIEIGANGHMTWLTPAATGMLDRHFPGSRIPATRLPDALARWLMAVRDRLKTNAMAATTWEPCVSQTNDARLSARYQSGRDGNCLIVLQEEVFAAAAEHAKEHGLTCREMEVLHWISEGKSNPEIAMILGRSTRTIHKHVEHILAKLGVETRLGAARKFHAASVAAPTVFINNPT